MQEEIVCLECGSRVGPTGCSCPPPSPAPRSGGPASRAPYREAPPAAACPRCGGRLRESTAHEALVLDCLACGGVFVAKAVIEQLDKPEGRDLRVTFPTRPRAVEPAIVRYLACPLCSNRMNRTSFARGANVVVDVCKEDGIWFDAGEVHAVIDFVESGGLERARRRAAEDRVMENEKLRAEWRQLHESSMRENYFGHLKDD